MNRQVLVSALARRYARAFLDASIKQRNFTKVLEELEIFQQQLEQIPMLREVFLNPAVPEDKRRKVLEEIKKKTGMQQLTVNILHTLIRRDRLKLLDQIIVSAELQFLERQGIVVVEVTTAHPLQPDEEAQLVKTLEEFTGKKVQIDNLIDSTVIGGAITKIGTTLYDGSVDTQLDQLRTKIVQS
ncbi:MAG TPA: ATP synthase F1 subunit delta [Acidobacteriota bacterium]|nr:ATP synthase F1 subunit delta [Acidobacteriota bacterium]